MIDIYKILKNKAMLVLTVLITTSCALTVPVYEEPSTARFHFPYEPESLNCIQLSEQALEFKMYYQISPRGDRRSR